MLNNNESDYETLLKKSGQTATKFKPSNWNIKNY